MSASCNPWAIALSSLLVNFPSEILEWCISLSEVFTDPKSKLDLYERIAIEAASI